MSEMKLTLFISTLCLLAIASLWIGDLFESFDVDGEEEVVTLPAKNIEQQVEKDLLPSDRLILEDHHFSIPSDTQYQENHQADTIKQSHEDMDSVISEELKNVFLDFEMQEFETGYKIDSKILQQLETKEAH
jgi:hypothetical protein